MFGTFLENNYFQVFLSLIYFVDLTVISPFLSSNLEKLSKKIFEVSDKGTIYVFLYFYNSNRNMRF